LPTAAEEAKQLAKALKAHLDRQPDGHRGYVQGDLPPVQEQLGEHRWLGLTMSPSVAALLHPHLAAVPLFTEGAAAFSRDGVTRPEGVLDVFTKAQMFAVESDSTKSRKKLVLSQKAGAMRGVRMFLQPCLESGDSAGIAAGPGVSAGVAAFVVPDDDVRQAALKGRGQRLGLGLKATRHLGQHEPFALYRCYVMTSLEYRKFLVENRGRKADIEAYTVELEEEEEWQPMKVDESGRVVENGDSVKLVYVGYGYGNEAALINAPQKDPIGLMNKHAKRAQKRFELHLEEDVVGVPNATVAMFYLGGEKGFPVPIAMTNENSVEGGSELLYCYGAEYWVTYEAAADDDKAVLEERKEAAEKLRQLQLQRRG
jgi:hypothetical protein